MRRSQSSGLVIKILGSGDTPLDVRRSQSSGLVIKILGCGDTPLDVLCG